MEAAADRAEQSARERARRLGIGHHDVLVLLGSGLSGAAEVLGAGEEPVPLATLPFFSPYTAGGHRAWGVAVGHRGHLATGTLMVVEDHLNMTGQSPLTGPDFVDMADAYSPRLQALALSTPVP